MSDDDRAEQAFRTALATRAAATAPGPIEVPAPRRHRRWPAALAAATLVVAIILIGAFRPHGHHDVPAPAGLPSGWRWESYRDVQVGVPDSWGYAFAPGKESCSGHSPRDGFVDLRTDHEVEAGVACAPPPASELVSLHLTFITARQDDTPTPAPAGWQTLRRTVGGHQVSVVTDDTHLALARQILATAHVVTTDEHGCAVRSPFQGADAGRPSPAFDVSTLPGVDSIAVCQYDFGVTGPGLAASLLLTGQAAQDELRALQSAPTGGGPTRARNCDDDRGQSGSTLLLSSAGQTYEMYAVYSGCGTNGIDDGTNVRELTRANCVPLFGPRVIDWEGIGAAFGRCTVQN